MFNRECRIFKRERIKYTPVANNVKIKVYIPKLQKTIQCKTWTYIVERETMRESVRERKKEKYSK